MTIAARLRELAFREFGCVAFHALTEGDEEVALSYGPDEALAQRWHAHPEHREAQRLGKEQSYASYSVEIARIERAYRMTPWPQPVVGTD